jgi:hypothetical protein
MEKWGGCLGEKMMHAYTHISDNRWGLEGSAQASRLGLTMTWKMGWPALYYLCMSKDSESVFPKGSI